MTTQDENLAKKGYSIKIGGGYSSRKKEQRHLYPPERLEKFLKVNANNEKEIADFCEKYQFIPKDLMRGLSEGFRQEQEKLQNLTRKILDKTFVDEDLDLIDEEIKGICFQTAILLKEGAAQTNDELNAFPRGDGQYDELSNDKSNERFIELVYKFPNSIASLYLDLVKMAKSKRPFRNCLQCGLYFTPNKRSPKQKFCSDECKDKHYWNHTKKYKKAPK